MPDSNTQTIPNHLGLILDGNRRWAKQNGLPTFEGHRRGAEVFKKISLAAFSKGVKFVSAYAFSMENWQRSKEEVNYIMNLAVKATEQYLDEFHAAGIKILILGERAGLSRSVLKAIERTESKTAANTKGTLGICFNYGGYHEIAAAAKKLIAQKVPVEDITPEAIEGALYGPEIPAIDLVVRTSGEQRVSGFMLWRSAYAEFVFVDKYWPDFGLDDLEGVIDEFTTRSRRFGGQ